MKFVGPSPGLSGDISYCVTIIAIELKLNVDDGEFGLQVDIVLKQGYVGKTHVYFRRSDGVLLWYEESFGESVIYDRKVPPSLCDFAKSLIKSTQAWLKAGPPLPEGCAYTKTL